jgi:hypothetical protein
MSQLQVTGEAKVRDIQGPVVANSGVITALDGAASQYVRGDGTLADFPTSSGGGSSVSYYLNSSVSQGTIGGVAYRELSKEPIIGAGTDIAISSNGYVASYLTDANDPDVLSIPGGNFNCEFYFSVNNNTGNPFFYAELYKYDGTTFTLLGSSVGVPEYINQGTIIAPYYFAIPVATAALALTDRLAIRIYVNVDGRTVTLHTENGHLCQVVTTLSKGMVSLNNLTDQSQFITTGTSGTDFNIVSSGDTHTFNIPSASASNRGLITTGSQTIAGYKTFNNGINIQGELLLSGATGYGGGIRYRQGIIQAYGSTETTTEFPDVNSIKYYVGQGTGDYKNFVFDVVNITLNATRTYTLPDASGTVALTSDISYPVTSVFGRTGAVVAVSGDYNTSQVTENTNLYFTDARARAALSFTAGSGAYNSTTGVITIPTNNNQITNGSNFITLTSLSAGTGISYNNTTGVITNSAPDQTVSLTQGAGISISGTYPSFTIASTITQYTDALARAAISLTTTGTSGAATYNSTTGVFNIPNYAPDLSGYVPTSRTITINGTSFDLSANRTYSVGTVTSVGLSSATSGVTIGSTPITTSGTITLAIATASGSQNGLLSSTDWTTFNNKQNALNNPVTGTGTSGQVAYFNGTTSITSESNLFWDATNDRLGIGTNIPLQLLHLETTLAGSSGVGTAIQITSGGAGGDQAWIGVNKGTGNGLEISVENRDIIFNTGATTPFGGTERMRLTSSGNLGLGVTPSAWNSVFKVLESGDTNNQTAIAFQNNSNVIYLTTNSYFDTSWKYKFSDNAGQYLIDGNEHRWYNAPSGTAGNAISFTQAMTLFANGNLAVGTTTDAGYKLDVTGNIRSSETVLVGNGAAQTELRINSLGGTNQGPFMRFQKAGSNKGYIGTYSAIISGTSDDLTYYATGSQQWMTNNSTATKMTLDASGRLGIGTTPSYKLHIIESTTNGRAVQGVATATSGTNYGAVLVAEGIGATKNIGLYASAEGATTNVAAVFDSGNVGIGTSSPSSLLTISATSGNAILRIIRSNTADTTNDFGSIRFENSVATTLASIRATSDNGNTNAALRFLCGTADTERMRITSGGKVNINNTSNTNYQLYVDGGSSPAFAAYSTSANNQFKLAGTAPGLTITNTITSPTIGGALGACTSANDFITGTAAGDMILINQYTGNKLYITNYSGGVYLTQGATSWTANSDIRIKNINSHITNAVEKLSTLQTINFCYKDDISKKENLGLIAQEVEMVFPELIETNNDGILGVRYTELIPVLIEAIKEQQEQIKELKLELDKIKNK